MSGGVYVLDDVIPKAYQDTLEMMFLNNKAKWNFMEDATAEGLKKLGKVPAFANVFYDERKPEVFDRTLFLATLPLAQIALDKIGYTEKYRPTKCRSFLQIPMNDGRALEPNLVHIDDAKQHMVVLYYVNDSDGDTVLYNQMYGEVPDKATYTDISYVTEYKRVSPKRGRAVVFDGLRYHTSSCPTDSPRCIINICVA